MSCTSCLSVGFILDTYFARQLDARVLGATTRTNSSAFHLGSKNRWRRNHPRTTEREAPTRMLAVLPTARSWSPSSFAFAAQPPVRAAFGCSDGFIPCATVFPPLQSALHGSKPQIEVASARRKLPDDDSTLPRLLMAVYTPLLRCATASDACNFACGLRTKQTGSCFQFPVLHFRGSDSYCGADLSCRRFRHPSSVRVFLG